jgi:hypothetical protein
VQKPDSCLQIGLIGGVNRVLAPHRRDLVPGRGVLVARSAVFAFGRDTDGRLLIAERLIVQLLAAHADCGIPFTPERGAFIIPDAARSYAQRRCERPLGKAMPAELRGAIGTTVGCRR